MEITSALEHMSIEGKIRAMETVWDDLCLFWNLKSNKSQNNLKHFLIKGGHPFISGKNWISIIVSMEIVSLKSDLWEREKGFHLWEMRFWKREMRSYLKRSFLTHWKCGLIWVVWNFFGIEKLRSESLPQRHIVKIKLKSEKVKLRPLKCWREYRCYIIILPV